MRETELHLLPVDGERSLLFLPRNHRAFLVANPLAERLRDDGLTGLTDEEAREWRLLEQLGLVSEENPDALRRSAFDDGAHLAINVNLTHACNLACTYCFAQGGDYGRMTKPMSPEAVDDIFAFIAEHVTSSQTVRFEFFGGEPLANPKLIDIICERAERVSEETGIRFLHRISTNLTLLPSAALRRFVRHRFVVSVSLDGPARVQDEFRPSRGGRGSYERIIANVEKVRAASEEITLVARMTVASSEPTLLERFRELWELDVFDYFQIYPAVYRASGEELSATGCASAPGEGPVVNHFLHGDMPAQFRAFLSAYPSFFQAGKRFRGVLEYERAAEMVLDGRLALAFCSGGRVYYTHSPNGAVSPCHRLAGDEPFDVGEARTGVTREHPEWRTSVDEHPVCSGCWARYLCGGGCKQENHLATGDLNVLNADSCAYQLMLAEEVLRTLVRAPETYRAGRRELDDLFVSCGRPVVANGRAADPDGSRLKSFRSFVPVLSPAADGVS
jgi:uncharacterized protein